MVRDMIRRKCSEDYGLHCQESMVEITVQWGVWKLKNKFPEVASRSASADLQLLAPTASCLKASDPNYYTSNLKSWEGGNIS